MILPKGNTPERQAAAWTLIGWLTSPEIAGEWSRFTGYFAPRRAAYDLPEMKDYLQHHPDAKVALDQLQYAVPWFDTYNTVAVRKAMEDQVQAILSGKKTPAEAVQTAQKNADELLRPYGRTNCAEAAGVTALSARALPRSCGVQAANLVKSTTKKPLDGLTRLVDLPRSQKEEPNR